MSLSPAPLSLLIKAAPILTDDMYGDIQPAAWELLLSVDEHMAAAAGESAVRLRISDPWVSPVLPFRVSKCPSSLLPFLSLPLSVLSLALIFHSYRHPPSLHPLQLPCSSCAR